MKKLEKSGVLLLVAALALIGAIGLAVTAAAQDDDLAQASDYFDAFQAAPYTDWPFQPGVPAGYYVGTEPHGMVLRVFVNGVAMQDVQTGAAQHSPGAVLIKENHMPGDTDLTGMEAQAALPDFGGNLAVLTYMVKVPGYNPDAGDWFWGRQQPDGTIDAAGRVEGCIGCHTQAAGNDYVFNSQLGGN